MLLMMKSLVIVWDWILKLSFNNDTNPHPSTANLRSGPGFVPKMHSLERTRGDAIVLNLQEIGLRALKRSRRNNI